MQLTTRKMEEQKVVFAKYRSSVMFMLSTIVMMVSIVITREYMIKADSKEQEHLFDSPAQIKALAFASNLSDIENNYIKEIDTALVTLRNTLKTHPIYTLMMKESNVIKFMNTHVYCVWDFMNLAKRLQIHFTSIRLPWRPANSLQDRSFRRLANEIILEEETDELDADFISHFSYYIECIRQAQGGELSTTLMWFLNDIMNESVSYEEIVNRNYLPSEIQTFLRSTKYSAVHDDIVATTSAFTFGREVMLPEIFTAILKESGIAEKPAMSKFVNYLRRHIHLDGDYHGYLAKKMVVALIKNQDDLRLAISVAKDSLEARIKLWDDIFEQLH